MGETCGSHCQPPVAGAGEKDSSLAFRFHATGLGVWALWWLISSPTWCWWSLCKRLEMVSHPVLKDPREAQASLRTLV